MFIYIYATCIGSLAEMKKLESNLLLEMLNPTCKSNEEQDNNNSGTKGSTKSKAQKKQAPVKTLKRKDQDQANKR